LIDARRPPPSPRHRTHTHAHVRIYIYIYLCVCVYNTVNCSCVPFIHSVVCPGGRIYRSKRKARTIYMYINRKLPYGVFVILERARAPPPRRVSRRSRHYSTRTHAPIFNNTIVVHNDTRRSGCSRGGTAEKTDTPFPRRRRSLTFAGTLAGPCVSSPRYCFYGLAFFVRHKRSATVDRNVQI